MLITSVVRVFFIYIFYSHLVDLFLKFLHKYKHNISYLDTFVLRLDFTNFIQDTVT